LAKAVGFSPAEVDLMLLAAPMHDVGKVATPDYILLKPGPLTAPEFEIMKQHTIAGHEILKDMDSELLRLAAVIALSHHERIDGNGYPYGLKGEAIPMCGRIVAICDVFDALLSERPYKKAWPLEQTLEMMTRARGKHFDPDVFDAFTSIMKDMLALRAEFAD